MRQSQQHHRRVVVVRIEAVAILEDPTGGFDVRQRTAPIAGPAHFAIEQPIDAEWKVIQPAAAETTHSLRRFSLRSEPGKTATLVVNEERDVREDFVLTSLGPENLELYLQEQAASPALKQALRNAIARKSALAALARPSATRMDASK